MAAGMGKRMGSPIPKVLHLLKRKPLLAHVLETARSLQPETIVVVVGHQAEKVRQEFETEDCSFVTQEEQLGTAHAVMQAEGGLEGFQGDVLILSGDVPLIRRETLLDLMDIHRQNGSVLSLISTVLEDSTGYGRIVRKGHEGLADGRISAIREEKDADVEEKKILEINAGIYMVEKTYLFEKLRGIGCKNKQNEYYLTDLIGMAVEESQPVFCYCTDRSSEVLGVNTKEDLEKMEQSLR